MVRLDVRFPMNAVCLCRLLVVMMLSGGAATAREARRLPGQVMVDPDKRGQLVYNRDADGDGQRDPCYLIGPGDPEGFLYLGQRTSDGTRQGGRQLQILEQMARHGGNVIYFQAVRSHGGDGAADHNPWRDPSQPASGLNPATIRQWQGWFDRMRDAGIVALFFLYDDGTHPFDDGCAEEPSAEEARFVRDLVAAFKDYPNLIWVVQEEFKYVGQARGARNPCNAARIKRTGRIAELIKQADPYGHPVGVHHNLGEPMAFASHPAIDVFLQQPAVEPKQQRGTLEHLHAAGQPGVGFDAGRRHVYFMAEAYNWHPTLCAAGDRAMLRKSYYASALTGGHVTVLGMYPTEAGADPTVEMLEDMRRMQRFFESLPFGSLAPHDKLAHGGTRWVLAEPAAGRYVLYADAAPATLGVKGLKAGTYALRWFDPVTGATVEQLNVAAAGEAVFAKPATIGAEAVLYLSRTKS